MKAAVLLLIGLVALTPARAQSPAELERIAMDYLETLEAMDWERQKTFYTEESVFEDPTSEVFGEPWHFVGPEEISGFWRASAESAGTLSIDNTYRKVFVTGSRVVAAIDARVRNDAANLGFPGEIFEGTIHVVSVLEIRDGKIVHHLDHADYAEALRVIEAFKAEMSAKQATED